MTLISVAVAMALTAAPAAATIKPLVVQSYSEDFGVSHAKAEETLETQRQAPGIVGQLQKQLGDRYAGVWFDNESGEFVVPLMAGANPASVDNQFDSLDLEGDFRTMPARASWAKLEATHEEVDEALLPLIEQGLVQTSLDPRTNAVVIQASEGLGDSIAVVRDLAAGADAPVEIRHSAGQGFGLEVSACKTTRPRACDPPLRGGVAISHDTLNFTEIGSCSAGFKATDGVSKYMLTAGHCAATYPKWSSPDSNMNNKSIGSVDAYSFPGGDWARIKTTNSAYWNIPSWPPRVAHYWEDQERTITAESWSYVGQYVCHSGNKTGTSCGNVSDLDVSGTDEVTGAVVNHLTEFGQVCSVNGDSGGPVFAGNTALGLYSMSSGESAEGKCDATGYYVEITEATTALGVSVGPRIGSPPPPPPPPITPPSVQTTAATNVQEEQATLNGTVNPNGSETTYYFDYGKTTAYGKIVPVPDAGAGAGTQSLAMYLPVALQPRTQYHFRIVATNAGGTSYGSDQVFTTGLRWHLRNANSAGEADVSFWFGLPGEIRVTGDWDGDGITTPGTYKPTTGVWKLRNSNTTGKADIEFQYGGGVWSKAVTGDWNGDGKTTIGVYDPTAGNWNLRNSNSAGPPDAASFQYGGSQFTPIAGDWDGNKTTTIGLYEPISGSWQLRNSNSAGSPEINFQYGGSQFRPVTGDWDGNKTTTIGLYEPIGGKWQLRNSNSAGSPNLDFQYGGSQFAPVTGDWDNSGTDTPGLANPSAGTLVEWRLRNTNSAGNADVAFEFADFGPKQVSGDWDGNGTTTIGTFDPVTGIWKLRNSNASGKVDVEFQYGGGPWIEPVTGDWDGNGTTTIGVYDPAAGNWTLRNANSAGAPNISFQYGGGAWSKPVTGDWDNNKTTTIGVYDPSAGNWNLRNSNSGGPPSISFQYGGAIWTEPVTGDWDSNGTTTIGVYDLGGGTWRLRNSNSSGNADLEFQYGGPVWGALSGDWNGDGVDTVAVATRWDGPPPPSPAPPSGPQYRYMLGTSNGGGIASWNSILGGMSQPLPMRVGDLTGDGKADIVAVELEGSGKYRYMLGTSNGSGIDIWNSILMGMSQPVGVGVGDLTGDGKADIVAVEPDGSGKYRYMLGASNGSGIASWKQILGGMSQPVGLGFDDLTGDGKADLVAVEPDGSGKYRYMLGTSNGSGIASWGQTLGGMSQPTWMRLSDLTGDGKADIVAVENAGGSYRYMLGTSNGGGIASWNQILSGMSNPAAVRVSDLTGDGKADIVAVEADGSGKYRYMLGTSNGSGIASWGQTLGGMSQPLDFGLDDVTGDGKADIVAVEPQ